MFLVLNPMVMAVFLLLLIVMYFAVCRSPRLLIRAPPRLPLRHALQIKQKLSSCFESIMFCLSAGRTDCIGALRKYVLLYMCIGDFE
jgi:hypothetical protein